MNLTSDRSGAGDAKHARYVVIAPSAELPPGFPFPATELLDAWAVFAWLSEHREQGGETNPQILRLGAQLLTLLLDCNAALPEDEQFAFYRFGDLNGPLDGGWTIRANGLRVTAAATFLSTRGTPEGEAKLGRRGAQRSIRPPKDFRASLAQLASSPEDDDDGGGVVDEEDSSS